MQVSTFRFDVPLWFERIGIGFCEDVVATFHKVVS